MSLTVFVYVPNVDVRTYKVKHCESHVRPRLKSARQSISVLVKGWNWISGLRTVPHIYRNSPVADAATILDIEMGLVEVAPMLVSPKPCTDSTTCQCLSC